MSNPQSKSSQARKSAAKASQSTSKSAHEILENLLADNEAQKEHIKLLEAENQSLSYAVGGRDLEIFDLKEEIKDHEGCVKEMLILASEADLRIEYWAKENKRLVDLHNQLGRDYTVLQTQNVSLAKEVDSAREQLLKSDRVVQSQRKVIDNIKQMLSLQQQIMSDVAGLK